MEKPMTLEDIKTETIEINELGHYILRIAKLLDVMPEDLQPVYAEQLLDIIHEYYKDIDELNKNIDVYKAQNSVVDISVSKLQKELDKFNKL